MRLQYFTVFRSHLLSLCSRVVTNQGIMIGKSGFSEHSVTVWIGTLNRCYFAWESDLLSSSTHSHTYSIVKTTRLRAFNLCFCVFGSNVDAFERFCERHSERLAQFMVGLISENSKPVCVPFLQRRVERRIVFVCDRIKNK